MLGDVGVGKTIFLRHLFRIDASQVLKDALVLYLDFGAEPALAGDLNEFVAVRLLKQLREDYGIDAYENKTVRAVYHAEINQLKRGVAGPLLESDPEVFKRKEIELLESLQADRGEHVGRVLRRTQITGHLVEQVDHAI